MKVKTLLLYMIIASAAVLTACATEEKATPFFKDTDLIEFTLSVTHGGTPISYVLPNSKCKFVVIGFFSGDLTPDSNNQLDETRIISGTRTNLNGFELGLQSWASVYEYDQTIMDFDDTKPFTNWAAVTRMVIWAYDSNYNLIASSSIITVN